MIKLQQPNLEMKKEIELFKNEFFDNGEESIHGAFNIDKLDIENWIDSLELQKNESTCPENRVPAHTFFIMNDDKIVGIINTRHKLNDYLLNFGGHIGYSIRPSERKKGYAKEALKLACRFLLDEIKTNKILLTCDKTNTPSKKTIESCGGILENEVLQNDRITLRYWIEDNDKIKV